AVEVLFECVSRCERFFEVCRESRDCSLGPRDCYSKDRKCGRVRVRNGGLTMKPKAHLAPVYRSCSIARCCFVRRTLARLGGPYRHQPRATETACCRYGD